MPILHQRFPRIHDLLYILRPTPQTGRRQLQLSNDRVVGLDQIQSAAAELTNPEAQAALEDADVVVLASLVGKAEFSQTELAAQIREIVTSRGSPLTTMLAQGALRSPLDGGRIVAFFPDLIASSAMIEALVEESEHGFAGLPPHIDFWSIRARSLAEARAMLGVAARVNTDDMRTAAISAMASGLGWTAWVKLFTVLHAMPETAGADDKILTPRSYEAEGLKAARQAAFEAIMPDVPVRVVAELILDLGGALGSAGPDMRAVYVDRLRAAVGDDADLRRASIEALLSEDAYRQRDLRFHSAIQLIEPSDEAFLADLIGHADRRIGYDAELVYRYAFTKEDRPDPWPSARVMGIAGDLFQIRLQSPPREEPQTWLGDRLLERIIEQTVAGEEERFAQAFLDHSEEGEEGLLRQFFADLAGQFRDLDQGLVAAARATRARYRTRISVDYRPVSKWEEGKSGINVEGDDVPPSFSADICLIIHPHLNGKALGSRATLIQAKRLRRVDPQKPELGLKSGFSVDPKQMTDLLRQTASSFYMFQCPGLNGRGLPMIPTQLVSDLAYVQGRSGKSIAHTSVGPASRSFADWFTYDVLALRTGDPWAELVSKTNGNAGARPRELCRFGTIEVEVRVGEEPKEEE
jgi:hypothetical protein